MESTIPKPALYLIPSNLGTESVERILPLHDLEIVRSLSVFIVENAKTARAFLKLCGVRTPMQEIVMHELDKHDPKQQTEAFLNELVNGRPTGLLSEAGCPAVADPGARIVADAHRKNLKVIPLTGPSSLLLALMGSGLEGQRFCFHGYLPLDKDERTKYLQRIEKEAQQRDQTQLFIETPYRNNALLKELLQVLQPDTKLCIAVGIHTDDERIETRKVSAWKKQLPELHKIPAVFLML